MKLNKRIALLCLTMIIIISGFYLSPEKVKAATKAEDGAIIIEALESGPHAFAADTDGENIYYSINFGGFKNQNTILLKGILKPEKKPG